MLYAKKIYCLFSYLFCREEVVLYWYLGLAVTDFSVGVIKVDGSEVLTTYNYVIILSVHHAVKQNLNLYF